MKNIRQLVTYFTALLGIFLLLSGCGATLATLSPLPTPQIIPTTLPTTATNLPVPTPRPSRTVAIGQGAETEISAFPSTCDNVLSSQLSPNKKWLALYCGSQKETTDNELIVGNSTGTKWKLKLVNFSASYAQEEVDSQSIYPIHWSPDSAYLYFAFYAGREDGGFCFYGFSNIRGVFRLDLQTGQTSTILALLAPGEYGGYQISFSPNGLSFTHTREGTNKLYLIDLLTGRETTFPIEANHGDFIWSPNSSSLAYATSTCGSKILHSFIKILTISNLSNRIAAQSDAHFLIINGWSKQDGLLDVDGIPALGGAQGISLLLDPNESILVSSATGTP